MSEKKIVIRFNYVSDKCSKAEPEPEMITEWNIRRIVGAALILAVLSGIAIGYLVTSGVPSKPVVDLAAPDKRTASAPPSGMELSDHQPAVVSQNGQSFRESHPVNGQVDTHGASSGQGRESDVKSDQGRQLIPPPDRRIVQAMLSKAVYHRRPVGVIDSPILALPDRAVGVYYFTELKGMTGQRISHEWWHEGKLVFKKNMTVWRDPANFYTSKLVNTNMLGTWQVYLKDGQGQVMDRRQFELLAPP